MNHDGRANTGPTSLLHLLTRRRVSFERWCEQEGIRFKEEFQAVRSRIEKAGEFFLDPELIQRGEALPTVNFETIQNSQPFTGEPTEVEVVEEPVELSPPKRRNPSKKNDETTGQNH